MTGRCILFLWGSNGNANVGNASVALLCRNDDNISRFLHLRLDADVESTSVASISNFEEEPFEK